jgi:hypothetical protein
MSVPALREQLRGRDQRVAQGEWGCPVAGVPLNVGTCQCVLPGRGRGPAPSGAP